MNTMTLLGAVPFGGPDDSVGVVVTEEGIEFEHPGVLDAARRRVAHRGQLQTWCYRLPMTAVRSVAVLGEDHTLRLHKSGLMTGLFRTGKSTPLSLNQETLSIRVEIAGRSHIALLKGGLEDVERLKRDIDVAHGLTATIQGLGRDSP